LRLTDVGELIGCSEAWISLIERGVKLPGSVRLARAIQRVAGIHADDWPEATRRPRRRRSDAAAA